MKEKYVLLKDYVTSEGTIPKNSDIILFRGFVYVNGGIIPQGYKDEFIELIKDPSMTKKVIIEKNEF